jgi:ABC-2 type transport system permease protein
MTAVTSGVEHQRPSVIGSDLRRFWNLTWTLAVTEFKLRFYGSVLGYVWTLARPFMFFGVIYFVFTEIVGANKNVPDYGVCVLVSLVVFQFFAEATSGCVNCLVVRESLLRKMRFPRLVIPLSVVLTAAFNLAATLLAVAAFAVIAGVYPTWRWLELPLIVGCVGAFAVGVGLLLSALFVRYRDVQPIWDVGAQMLLYASPVLYVATIVPGKYLHVYMLNPLATCLTQLRHAVVDPSAPSAAALMGGTARLAVPAAIVVGFFALGAWVFKREAPRIAENL